MGTQTDLTTAEIVRGCYPRRIPATVDYRKEGYIDSLGFVQFVLRLEATFMLRFTQTELESAEFRTLDGIAKLIDARAV